jgi:outer membrane protein assembly factor BamB
MKLSNAIMLALVAVAISVAVAVVYCGSAAGQAVSASGPARPMAGAAGAGLGAPTFLPTPDQAIGWRGDGTGRYPGATPPKEWYLRIKDYPGLACAGSKPKVAPAKLEADIALNDWIAIGPWVVGDLTEAMNTSTIPDETALEPSEGDKVGDKQWKKLPTQNGAVNFADLFGESTRSATQKAWDDPQQQKLIYAATYVYSPVDGEAGLYTTHGNGYRVYVNGQIASKRDKTGEFYGGIPRMDRVPLKQGWNRVLLKSYGWSRGPMDKGWAFSAWMKLFPAKGVKSELEAKNIAYAVELPRGSQGKTPGPIVVGDKLFLTGEHWLAALHKQDGQLSWYRSIIAFDGHAKDAGGEPADVEQYTAACKAVHELDAQYPSQFKDGKLPAPFEAQYKQLKEQLAALLEKMDPKRAAKLKGAWEQGEPGAAMTPCSDGKFVYAWSENATAVCYDLDGKPQWFATVEHPGDIHHGYAISPVLAEGKFICAQNTVWAFDAKTGAVLWNSPRKGSQWGSLIRAQAGKDTVLVEQGNFIRNLATGQLISDKGGKDTGSDCCSTSIPIEGGRVFGIFGVFDLVDLGAGAQHAGIPRPESVGCGGLYADGCISSPVYHDGLVYTFTEGGTLAIIDLKAGKVVSTEHLDTRVNWGGRSGITASPAFAGGLLYFFDDSGNTLIREPGIKGKVIARNPLFPTIQTEPGRLEPAAVAPTFDAARIYWRVNSRLYCIGEK